MKSKKVNVKVKRESLKELLGNMSKSVHPDTGGKDPETVIRARIKGYVGEDVNQVAAHGIKLYVGDQIRGIRKAQKPRIDELKLRFDEIGKVIYEMKRHLGYLEGRIKNLPGASQRQKNLLFDSVWAMKNALDIGIVQVNGDKDSPDTK